MRILAERRDLSLPMLYSGRVSIDDLPRAAQYADLSAIQLPSFLWDIRKYAHWLDELARPNSDPESGTGPEPKPYLKAKSHRQRSRGRGAQAGALWPLDVLPGGEGEGRGQRGR